MTGFARCHECNNEFGGGTGKIGIVDGFSPYFFCSIECLVKYHKKEKMKQ